MEPNLVLIFRTGFSSCATMPVLLIWNFRSGSDETNFLMITIHMSSLTDIYSIKEFSPRFALGKPWIPRYHENSLTSQLGWDDCSLNPPLHSLPYLSFPVWKWSSIVDRKFMNHSVMRLLYELTYPSSQRTGSPNPLKDEFLSFYLCYSAICWVNFQPWVWLFTFRLVSYFLRDSQLLFNSRVKFQVWNEKLLENSSHIGE